MLLIHIHFHNDLGLSRATVFHCIWRQVIIELLSKYVMGKLGISNSIVVHQLLISQNTSDKLGIRGLVKNN